MTQFRSYCFTINNDTYDDLVNILALPSDYLIFGFEKGSDKGTEHIQGYVYFSKRIRFNKLKKMLPRAHIESANGSPDQNITYCSKEGEFYEFGTKPRGKGAASWDKIEEAFKDPANNVNLIRMYKNTYTYVKEHQLKQINVDTKFYVIDPIFDAIGQISEYFNGLDDSWVIITELAQLSYYDNPQNIIYYCDFFDKVYNLWPRKVPILYKYGYEQRTVKPKRFVIVSNTPNMYSQYKKI